MHSVDPDGVICVNLNDFNELSDSIRFRTKIDFLIEQGCCPPEISNFSIAMLFRGGARYYLSNLYLWAIPYRTEGLYRGDVDHDRALYHGKEFFIQRDVKYDTMQIPIIQILESRYKLSTSFAMIRQCHECDIIIEAYNTEKILDPEALYHHIRDQFEQFICYFLDNMQKEILSALPQHKWLNILHDQEYRKKVLSRQVLFPCLASLSPREIQCLSLIAEGLSIKEIAAQLFLSPETVNTHAKSIRHKMDCKNISEAVAKAFRWGML